MVFEPKMKEKMVHLYGKAKTFILITFLFEFLESVIARYKWKSIAGFAFLLIPCLITRTCTHLHLLRSHSLVPSHKYTVFRVYATIAPSPFALNRVTIEANSRTSYRYSKPILILFRRDHRTSTVGFLSINFTLPRVLPRHFRIEFSSRKFYQIDERPPILWWEFWRSLEIISRGTFR